MNDFVPLEQDECILLVNWLELLGGDKILEFSHTAQETYTKSWHQKAMNKKMGVRPGVPDYIVVTQKAVLFVEMKRKKGGAVTKAQARWLKAIHQAGGEARICYGFDDAKKFIEQFI